MKANGGLQGTPVSSYATYLGGAADDESLGLAVDSSGNAFVAGITRSTDFPTVNPVQSVHAGDGDVFVTKLDPSGSSIIFSTYFGGSGRDMARAIAIDAAGAVYLTGQTASMDFPTTAGAVQRTFGGGISDAFLIKLSPAGALVYSTYIGGSDREVGRALTVDTGGRVYLVGRTGSDNFPTRNPIQATHGSGPFDAFMLRINANGSTLEYSSFLGGQGDDGAYGVVIDQTGAATIAGYTNATNFPVRNAIQPLNAGAYDALVWKVTPQGTSLAYSTYLGGAADDFALAITADPAGDVYITGGASSPDFPRVHSTRRYGGGIEDAFVSKLKADGSVLMYSALLGGTGFDLGFGIAIDPLNHVYIAGRTDSRDYPVVDALQATYGGGTSDSFVSRLEPATDRMVYSTYVGGNDFDSSGATDVSSGGGVAVASLGEVFLTGFTSSTNFPTASPLQAVNRGGVDSFIVRLSSIEVTDVTPASGISGTRVNLRGTNFAPGAAVSIGGVAANVVSQTPTSIEAIVGTRTVAGPADVMVRNPNGQQALLESGFFYARPSNGRLSVDAPQPGVILMQPFVVTGWAIDEGALAGTGVDAVQAYAVPRVSGSSPVFLGDAAYGSHRDDVAAIYGARFGSSGFTLVAHGLPAGGYMLLVSARSTNTRSYSVVQTREVSVLAEGIPGTPIGLTTAVNGRSVTLQWSAAAGAPPATSYVIEAGSTPGASDRATVGLPDARTTVTFDGVPDGTYYVRVRGRNAAGTGLPSGEGIVSVGCAPPAAPRSLRFFQLAAGQAGLSWSSPEGGAPLATYVLLVGSRPGLEDLLAADVGMVTSVTGTAPSGEYYARVRARNECGTGAASSEVRFIIG